MIKRFMHVLMFLVLGVVMFVWVVPSIILEGIVYVLTGNSVQFIYMPFEAIEYMEQRFDL